MARVYCVYGKPIQHNQDLLTKCCTLYRKSAVVGPLVAALVHREKERIAALTVVTRYSETVS